MLIDNLVFAIFSLSSALESGSVTVSIMAMAAYAVLVLLLIIVFDYTLGWVERKVIAKIHTRHGPTYVGKYGLLQNLADFTKLLAKEHTIPQGADRLLFLVTIPLMLAISIFLVLLLPFSPSLIASNISLGVLVVFVASSFMPLMVFVSGFSSGNKFAAISAQRSVMMFLSYEIPMIVVVATVAFLANSYSFFGVINAQTNMWFVFLTPIGFFVLFIAMLADLDKPPFDMREANSELIAGWLTDVGAPRYALSLFMDHTRMFLGSLVIAMLFFGGWLGPVLPPVAWLLIKSFVIAVFITIVRATTARMRMDGLLRLGWIWLMPLSILNLIITFMIFIR